jgi:hypothetical protein
MVFPKAAKQSKTSLLVLLMIVLVGFLTAVSLFGGDLNKHCMLRLTGRPHRAVFPWYAEQSMSSSGLSGTNRCPMGLMGFEGRGGWGDRLPGCLGNFQPTCLKLQ